MRTLPVHRPTVILIEAAELGGLAPEQLEELRGALEQVTAQYVGAAVSARVGLDLAPTPTPPSEPSEAEIGGGMRAIRQQAGISQPTLARRIRTTQSAVSEYERGQVEPQVSTLRRYAAGAEHMLKVLAFQVEPSDRTK